MKRILVLLFSAFLLTVLNSCKTGNKEGNIDADTLRALIPQPVHVSYSPGHFTISGTTGIFCPGKLRETASLVAEQIGIKKPVNTGKKGKGIFLTVDTRSGRASCRERV